MKNLIDNLSAVIDDRVFLTRVFLSMATISILCFFSLPLVATLVATVATVVSLLTGSVLVMHSVIDASKDGVWRPNTFYSRDEIPLKSDGEDNDEGTTTQSEEG